MTESQDANHTATVHSEGNHGESDLLDADTRRQLIEDDREAWKLFVSLLLVIVIGGLCLGFFGVFMSIYF